MISMMLRLVFPPWRGVTIAELQSMLKLYEKGIPKKAETLAGLRESMKLKHGALSLYVGNGMRAAVEAIGSFDLFLHNVMKLVSFPSIYRLRIPRIPANAIITIIEFVRLLDYSLGYITPRLASLVCTMTVRISQKSQENSQKRANTDTRIRRVQKEAKDPKP
ncbi:hypothetical protein Tco_0782440 [Tanacetum coccineum]